MYLSCLHKLWCTSACDIKRDVPVCIIFDYCSSQTFTLQIQASLNPICLPRALIFLPPLQSSVSGKTFWRQPKLWSRTQRCWCLAQLPVRTSWLKPPSLPPKPLPSSQMWSNWELPALAQTTLRLRLTRLVFLPSVCPLSPAHVIRQN